MNKLNARQDLYLGSDPEFFFSKKGGIIGSEKVISEHGLINQNGYGSTVRDGVQAEMHPKPDTCRQRVVGNIHRLFLDIVTNIPSDVKIDFYPVVEVTKEELATLKIESQTFGCAESKNAHLKTLEKISKIGVDPKKYMKRSAGGHIHLGFPVERFITGELNPHYRKGYETAHNPDIMIPILDIILGNTCVLIDRNEANIERRKVYGRAGEYRTPPYGIEYRTLSNFWLRHHNIVSLVMGLARMAVEIVVCSTKEQPYYEKLLSLVDMEDIQKAINNNDFDLAMENYEKIELFLIEILTESGFWPITPNTIKEFRYFIEKGLDHWYPSGNRQIIDGWVQPWTETTGFNLFLAVRVRNERLKELGDKLNK